VKCPDCSTPLDGLGTFCWTCEKYVDQMGQTAQQTKAPKDERSEKEIQEAAKRALRMMGFSVWDTSQPHAAKITPGLADLCVAGRGITAFIEVKSAKGKQTDEQERFQRAVVANGGLYLCARHEAEVVEWLTEMSAVRCS
jgi:uncharacterized Zn finger protein (UPF0148 family)